MLLFAVVEVPFQVEEAFFRRDLELARAEMDKLKDTNPKNEDVASINQKLRNRFAGFWREGERFSLSWKRPLSPGHDIWFASGRGVSVQD